MPSVPRFAVEPKDMRPLCEDNLPALIVRESFSVNPDVPVRICSPAASRINGS